MNIMPDFSMLSLSEIDMPDFPNLVLDEMNVPEMPELPEFLQNSYINFRMNRMTRETREEIISIITDMQSRLRNMLHITRNY